jgi:ribosomal protein S18 acetylase RimI-like enzyme
MTFQIRRFREPDRVVLRHMTIDAFEGVSIEHNIDLAFGTLADRDWRWRKARWAESCFSGTNVETLVAEGDGAEILGYVSLRFDRESNVGHIPDLVVVSQARGHGLGRALVECALERFRAEGMRLVRIETLEQNAIGQHLYPALGFQEVARQIHYARPLTDE